MMKQIKPLIALLLATFWTTSTVHADADPMGEMKSLVQGLQKQMQSMQRTIEMQNEKINLLEDRETVQLTPTSTEGAAAPMTDYEFNERLGGALGGANKWLKDLSLKGDLRLRYEAFDNHTGNPADTADRNRFRYRLRYGFEKKFSEEMKLGFSMASGERAYNNTSFGGNVDPTSTNTTFDNNFNFKDIFIEKAFAQYNPKWAEIGIIDKLTLKGGKIDNPFEKGSSDMIWDRDVKPEGLSEKFDFNLIDGSDLDMTGYLTLGQFVLDEDAAPHGDAELFAHQIGINPVVYTPLFERPVDFHSAFSWYSYRNFAESSNFLLNGASLARGNANAVGPAVDLDAGDFEVIELYNEIAVYPMGLPTRFFFDWALNADNDNQSNTLRGVGTEEDSAWSFGTKLGGILKKGDWEASYAYKRIAANSVVGAFNDSDFGTNAHAGTRGNVIKLGYALTDNLTLNSAAFFVNNLNTGTGPTPRSMDEEQRRFQMDLVWKF